MTEKDGQTRVYITSARNEVWEVYPEEKPYDERIVGEAALAILSRVDFRGVNSESFKIQPDGQWGEKVRDEWGMFSPDGKSFSVNRKGWKSDEHYSKLAKILQKRAHKKGLTIVVS